MQHADEVPQREALVAHQALDLRAGGLGLHETELASPAQRMKHRTGQAEGKAGDCPGELGTWWNSARCVRSMASLRKTRSMEKYLAGRNPSCASWYSCTVHQVSCLSALGLQMQRRGR